MQLLKFLLNSKSKYLKKKQLLSNFPHQAAEMDDVSDGYK